ncbi:MAG: tRNA 4-thiouridine(8) synthase ThiI [Firmicutes bacterium]|nr:tRNA 4-thiouridine(8) synthase ThiI [Bacillota bacterium]
MRNVLLIKYGEIAIRGKNRYLAENRLIRTIIKRIENFPGYMVYKEQGRLLAVNEEGDFDYEKIIPIVVNILGVIAVCPGVEVEDQDIKSLQEKALEHFNLHFPENSEEGLTFKVFTKRSDKRYPLNGNEVSALVGGYILQNREDVKVDVHEPKVKVHVELRNNAYIYSKVIPGRGGLPYGSGGKALVLMSGGIDSPVAAYLTARRGVEVEAVYFDSPPYTSERAKQKVYDLAERLSLFTGNFRLYVVPFTQTQLCIYKNTPPVKMTILLKRAMLKAAEKIALKNKQSALVTGDSIGQVASQTLEAINAINFASEEVTVLRPLTAMDKQQIIDVARDIGTYDISIRPYEDCCTVFVAKHPETKPKKSIIEAIERKIEGLDKLIDEAVKKAEIVEFGG